MLDVEIKYNPYTVKTELLIDGVEIPYNDHLMQLCENKRLQYWIDTLLLKIYEERRDGEINLVFKGLSLDGEDVKDAAKQLREDLQKQNIRLDISTKVETKDTARFRIKDLLALFEEGKNCPYHKLAEKFRSSNMRKAFDNAMGAVFEVNVVATMSSGKSTFINALLGQELLPAANEATTATIARIIDRDTMNDFRGQRFDKNGQLLGDSDELITWKKMKEWNDDPNTSFIDVEGNIPTIEQTENMAIAFIDTPGPNNSRNEEHYRTTVETITSKPLSMIIYVLNGTQLGIGDDKRLLEIVREAMEKGGRQAQDRFVFVANKIDNFDPEREDIGEALNKIKEYLRDNGIKNPMVIPVSALLALLLRQKRFYGEHTLTTKQKGTLNELSNNFLDIPEFNMINYVKGEINPRNIRKLQSMLDQADDEQDDAGKAEVLCGIPIIEMLLNDFLQKHAVPAKLKDAVDSFKVLSDLENQIASTTEILEGKEEDLLKSIEALQKFQTSKERIAMANNVKEKIETLTYQTTDSTKKELQQITLNSEKLSSKIDSYLTQTPNIDLERAEDLIEIATLRCQNFAMECSVALSNCLNEEFISQINSMRHEYEAYAAEVLEKNFPEQSPLKKLQKNLLKLPDSNVLISANKQTETEDVVVGKRWVPPEKSIFKPWTWFRQGHYEDVIETVTHTYVDTKKIAEDFSAQIHKFITDLRADFEQKAAENLNEAKKNILIAMAEIDTKMQSVVEELQKAQADEEIKQTSLDESKRELNWLKEFNQKLDDILAI